MRFVGAEVMDYLLRMRARVHLGIHLQNSAVGADDVRDALIEPQYRDSIIGAVGLRDLLVGVEQQRERQPVLPDKAAMSIRRIDATSEHVDSPVLQARITVAERAGLFRASGRIVLRIEVKNDLVAAIITQMKGNDLIVEYRIRGDAGRNIALLEHRRARGPRPERDDCGSCYN